MKDGPRAGKHVREVPASKKNKRKVMEKQRASPTARCGMARTLSAAWRGVAVTRKFHCNKQSYCQQDIVLFLRGGPSAGAAARYRAREGFSSSAGPWIQRERQ